MELIILIPLGIIQLILNTNQNHQVFECHPVHRDLGRFRRWEICFIASTKGKFLSEAHYNKIIRPVWHSMYKQELLIKCIHMRTYFGKAIFSA